jgi:oxygen-independent coproporphyrinogen III oxidase
MDKQDISVQINLASFAFGLPGVSDRQNYMKALKSELASAADYSDTFEVNALCITGPHPFQYNGTGIAEIIKTLAGIFTFQKNAEITVDALPGSVVLYDLLVMREHGVRRISFDIRSFIQSELDSLNRKYSPSSMEVFMRMVQQKVTFYNYDITLYYGIPGQTAESIHSSVDMAMRNMAMHITLLPFKGADNLLMQTLYLEALEVIGSTNYEQYTPYHFARPGFACEWNKLTYANQPSLGFGIGAHSKIEGVHCENTSDVSAYIAAEGVPSATIVGTKEITPENIKSDVIKNELFNLRDYDLSTAPNELRAQVVSLCERGLLAMDGTNIGLTLAGKVDWQAVATALTL